MARSTQAPKRVTSRGVIAVAGEDVTKLIDNALRGVWTYEENFFKILSSKDLDPTQTRIANAILLGLAVCQGDDADIDLTRLCAGTGTDFPGSIRPSLHFYERTAQVASYLRRCVDGMADARQAQEMDAVRLAKRGVPDMALPVREYLRRLGFENRYTEMLARWEEDNPGCRVDMDGVAAAFLLEIDADLRLAPFVKIVARVPVLANAYLKERALSPNRYVGLETDRPPTSPDTAYARQRALELLEAGTYVDLVLDLMADITHPSEIEQRVSHAALIAGAQYGKTAASSTITRLMATRGTPATVAYQAVMSTFGFYHLGALMECVYFLCEALEATDDLDSFLDDYLRRSKKGRFRVGEGKVAGFGHRFQVRDPRAAKLLAICRRFLPGRFTNLALQLDTKLYERRIGHINMDGIGAVMALQVGFSAHTASALSLIARTPGILLDYVEDFESHQDYGLKVRGGLL